MSKTLFITALILSSLVAGVGEAAAQAANNNRGQSSTTPGGDPGTGSAIVRYGTNGNCPPTIACAPNEPRQPNRDRHRRVLPTKCHHQVQYWEGGVLVRACRDQVAR